MLNEKLFDKLENFWPWAFMKATRPKKAKKTSMAQNAQNCLIQREMQKQPKIFKKCQRPGGVWILGQMAFGVGITSIYM